ncbi:hypothetical protein G6F56_002210 [Rhizopus delemar]|uniref:NmrA-like domain-containing protein n=1 Tax=Rhizopus stolonifer TaxID=4846 RepID=A0A367KUH5_RHIST|nr:hypothetical protein G6F56_002210 [Rhizopus delemar]RCI05532.1 hypothetical protein CU098_008220 [Rhizopus stolonifer]
MSTSTERVFIIGGTGNVGSKTVNDLLAKNIPVTLYARQPEKVNKLFANNSLVQVVQGDYDDLAPLKEGLKGHTRLFLLIADLLKMVDLKKKISSWAYEAGVKQIVDISSVWASMPWRSTSIGASHYYAEKAIYEIPNRGAFVTLRPGRFMSNLFFFDGPKGDYVVDTLEENSTQGWISPNDIGAVAAVVLSEPVEKHADLVYELSGDLVTPAQRTQYLSRAIGREFTYKKISPKEKYDAIMSIDHFNHAFAYTLAASLSSFDIQHHHISDGIIILLGREPETLEKFIFDNKAAFK